jgi:hypothetical protein
MFQCLSSILQLLMSLILSVIAINNVFNTITLNIKDINNCNIEERKNVSLKHLDEMLYKF